MKPETILNAQIEAWKTAVETQRHFNDVAMKIRHFGFVLIAAVVGAAGFSFKSGFEVEIPFTDFSIPIASLLFASSGLLWWFIWFLDSKWYTPFLKGAVISGTKLEKEIGKSVPRFSLCHEISDASQSVKIVKNGRTYNSSERSKIFHFGMIYTMLLIAVLMAFFDNINNEKKDNSDTSALYNLIDEQSKPTNIVRV